MAKTPEEFMRGALDEARIALERRNFPCGVALARGEEVLVRARSEVYDTGNLIRHGEIVAIEGYYRRRGSAGPMALDGVVAYVTTEPCLMCATALIRAGVRRVIWGTREGRPRQHPTRELLRACGLLGQLEWTGGVLETECLELLNRWRDLRRRAIESVRGLAPEEAGRVLTQGGWTPAHLEMWTRAGWMAKDGSQPRQAAGPGQVSSGGANSEVKF